VGADHSFLTGASYGYDFFVATTQASINSGLRAYVDEGTQPVDTIVYLADPDTGNPTDPVTLDELKQQTGGISPFDIPAGTDWKDPRIDALTKARFVVGIKLQIGLPPGVLPKDLPPIVTFCDSANNIGLTLFCSQFEVIQNSPPNAFGGGGSLDVWGQP